MASSLNEFCILSKNDGGGDDDDDDDSSSEDESSGSSGEDVESGDDDDDEESEDEVLGIEEGGSNLGRNIHSSEDDPERECCPVCLNKFIGQDLGTPESCDHTFCFDCIKEWSKNINTCPIDRTEFNYIHLRAVPGGSVLKQVKVKVQPKEPENAEQESVTLCEVCHSGDREDRLLLCDGCDLAYHCECLDPPLFYIPIEEWFCPPCSGVFQNRAVAGPSGSRRRVIPRTRASETVRSRVQNLRTGSSSAPRSTSRSKSSSVTKSTRKRKRRSYGRTYKKVVQLARTKKDMTSALKNKVGVRGSTVIVTYRRRRKRRTTKRKFSRKSVASTKALPIPSTKQRIAKHLGISKPQGSSAPQVKQSVASRSASGISRMPAHSLFGNRDQLMDFDENFNEDVSNKPSTSSSTTSQRCSNYSSSPSTSGINILDSIMAGQKLLHCKSDKITIKTDGTLILKDRSSSSKTTDNVKKSESVQPSRVPMSVALVKTGIKGTTSSTDKKHASASACTSKAKDVTGSKISKPPREKIVSKTNSSNSQWTSKDNSSNTKSYSDMMNNYKMSKAKEYYKKSSASQITEQPQKQKTTSTKKVFDDEDKTVDTLMDEFQRDIPSDWESEISKERETNCSNEKAKRADFNQELESSRNSTLSCIQSYKSLQDSSDTTNMSVETFKTCIKKEVVSDEETNSGTVCSNEPVNSIYKKLSEETETGLENGGNRQQVVKVNGIISKIKAEPVSSDSEPDINNDCLNIQKSGKDEPIKFGTCKTEDSDCEASQSVIDTSPMLYSLSKTDFNNGISLQRMIKEEVSSDTEDFSQSLVASADPNFVSQSISPDFSNSRKENVHNEKGKEFFNSCTGTELKKVHSKDADTSVPLKFLSKTSIHVSQSSLNCSENENLPCTQVSHPSERINCSSDDDDIPCTQAVSSPALMEDTSDEDEDIPCTQAVSSPAVMEDTSDGDLPCTQVVPLSISRNNYSDDDDQLPCTQAVPLSVARSHLADEDELPCTQVVPLSVARSHLEDEDELPCTQVLKTLRTVRNNSSDEDLPCTQAVSVSTQENNFSDDDLPCTQAISLSLAKPDVLDDDSLPSTQAVCSPFVKPKPSSNIFSFQKSRSIGISKRNEHSTDSVSNRPKDVNMCDEIPATQINVLSRTKSKSLLNSCLDECSDDDIPPTQINFEFLKPAAVSHKPVPSRTSSENTELLPTQCLESSKSLAKKLFTKDQRNIQDNLAPTQICRANPETVGFSETQPNTLVNESFHLPATQIFNVSSKRVTVPCKYDLTKETNLPHTQFDNDLPATQVSYSSSKEKNISKFQNNDIDNEPFSLPATQVFNPTLKQSHLYKNSISNEDLESFSLPATQINTSVPDAIKDLDVASDPNFIEVSPASSEVVNISSDKLMLSKSTCPHNESEKTESSNINDILSNIKHLVKSLSSKVPEDSSCEGAESNEGLLHKNQENASASNLNSKTVESITTENTSDRVKDTKNLERKDQENLHIDLNDSEKLSHEKLREMASKSSHIVPKRNVGIHKHLPQVIPKLPVKDHVKLKPSNRRTFSFEEVAKLEEPQKISRNSSTDSLKKISNGDVIENTASDDDDDDDLPPTQKVDFESIMSKSTGNKNNSESYLKTAELKSHQPELNSLKIAERFHVSSCSRVEGSDDFPTTQLNACLNRDVDSSKTPPVLSSMKSKVVSKAQTCANIGNQSIEFSSDHHVNKNSILLADTDEVNLPTTEISTMNENILSRQMNTNELLSSSDENNAHVNKQKTSKNKHSVNIISIKSRVTSKHSKDKKISNYIDTDDLPSTQVSNNISVKKSSNISNNSIDRPANSKLSQINSSNVDSDNTLRKKNSNGKSSEKHMIKESVQSKTKEPSSDYEFDDLPATQVSESTRKALKSSSHQDDINKNYSKNAFKLNKYVGSISSDKSHSSKSKALSAATDTSDSTVHKQKGFDDIHKKKECNLKNTLSNMGNKESSKEKRSKKSCEQEKNLLEAVHKSYKNLSSNSSVERSVSDASGKQLDFSLPDNYNVTVKQEKIDNDFEVPLIETQKPNVSDSSSHDIGKVRIKTENLSDSLPATQVATFNQANNSIEGSDINNVLLSSTSIKREICSDDEEITIIEPVTVANSKVQEEIVIDDEDKELTVSHIAEKSQPISFIKQEKEIPAHTEINVVSVKVEKTFVNNKTVLPKIKHQSTKSSKHGEKRDSKSSATKENGQMNDKECASSNLIDNSHKPGDKRKNHQTSKEENKKARNENLQSKPENSSHKHGNNTKGSKNLSDSSRDKRSEKKLDYDSLKSKSSVSKHRSEFSSVQPVKNQENLKLSVDKQKTKNSEKENNNASLKNCSIEKNVIITLKPSKKRPRENSETKRDHKREKCSYLDTESCSSDNSSNKTHLGTNTNSNIKLKKTFDIMDDKVSSSTPSSDMSVRSVNPHYGKDASKTLQTKDVKKILSKQDLKEEIANEVKLVLKPFFNTGLITKDDYKDIMRRAVPKIFMNCHNCINQEKIRKLVLSYVTMLSKS